MNIKHIYEQQVALQNAMGNPGGEGEAGATQMLLAAIVEVTEVLDEINWKPWKPKPYKDVDKSKVATELMDVIQFIINTAIYMDISHEELENALRVKWDINFDRISMGLTTKANFEVLP